MKLYFSICILLVLLSVSRTETAQCTYRSYAASDPLAKVTCSDGKNGLISTFGYKDLTKFFPYVTAWDNIAWNSPKCGACIELTYKKNSIYLTTIDQCRPSKSSYDPHFDMSKEAFEELFGEKSLKKDSMTADWKIVDTSYCKGNTNYDPKKISKSTSPQIVVPTPLVPLPPDTNGSKKPDYVSQFIQHNSKDSGTAYVHLGQYQKSQQSTEVSCSNGENGLIAKYGRSNLSSFYPYVLGWSKVVWNSPNCGKCIQISYRGKQVYASAVDGIGSEKGYDSTFTLSKELYEALFQVDGSKKLWMIGDYSVVDNKYCELKAKDQDASTPKSSQQTVPTPLVPLPSPNTQLPSKYNPLYVFQTVSIPAIEKGSAYVLMGLYYKTMLSSVVSCSNGDNGLMTKFGKQDLSSFYPYVVGWSKSPWNSPNCGACIQIIYNGYSVFASAIDGIGSTTGYESTFTLSKELYENLFQVDGSRTLSMAATYTVVDGQFCKLTQKSTTPTPTTSTIPTPLVPTSNPTSTPTSTNTSPYVSVSKVTTVKEKGTAYVQIGTYQKTYLSTQVSCSDGDNGLIVKYNKSDFSSFYPYVLGWSKASWNSPNCGACIEISYNGYSVYASVVDGIGSNPGYDSAFTLSKELYEALFKVDSTQKMNMVGTYAVVGSEFCKLTQ